MILLINGIFTLWMIGIFTEGCTGQQHDLLLEELSGAHLRISIHADPPWTTEQRYSNGTVTYEGCTVDIANYMAQALNVTFSFVSISKEEVQNQGPFQAYFNLLKADKADFITRFMDVIQCARVMDCSLPMLFQGFQLLVPWPEKETHIVSPIRPFQDKVWICLSFSIVLVSVGLIFLRKYYKRTKTGKLSSQSFGLSFHKAIMYLVAGEGDWNVFNQLSFRLIQGAWCLAAVVLFNAYCSTLISYIISPRMMPMAKTYGDVASGHPQKLKFLAEKNEIMAATCLAATSGPLKGLGDLFRKHPESQFTDKKKAYEFLFTGQYAYAAVELRILLFLEAAFINTGGCKYIVSNQTLDRMAPLAWGFPKNWRYTNAVNHRLRGLAESGLINYWVKKITPKNERCKAEKEKAFSPNRDQRKILSLYDLSGPFILLITGFMLSIFVFLIEKVCYHFKHRN